MCLLFLIESADAQQFVDRAQAAGLQNAFNGHGVSVADYDLDGDLDLYLVSYQRYVLGDPRTWNRLYRNNNNGTFTEVTEEAGVRVETDPSLPARSMGNKMGASWGDYDNDGDPDLILTNAGPEVLFRNQGDGTFLDVADAAGLNTNISQPDTVETATPLWWDYDQDGDLDLYISSWNRENRLYQNQGDGTFEDIASTTGMHEPDRTLMALPSDYNLDGLPDLYVINDFTRDEDGIPKPGVNHLYLANGDGTFRDATFEYGLGMRGNGMGATLGDFNNDGYFEIYLTNISTILSQPNPFYLGGPSPPFPDIAADLGVDFTDWGWGTEFFDADHDGDLDLFAVNGFFPFENNTPNYFFVNTLYPSGTAGFDDKSVEKGLDGYLRTIGTQDIYPDGHGMVTFDYDNDGDLDIVVGNWAGSTDPAFLYENRRLSGNWFQVGLEGVQSNRDGFGAVLHINTNNGDQYRSYDGADYMGQSIQPVHFGVRNDEVINTLTINWPNGLIEEYYDLEVNQVFQAVEGGGIAVSAEKQLPHSLHISVDAYPNPANQQLTVELDPNLPGVYLLEIVDLLGRSHGVMSLDLMGKENVSVSHMLPDSPGMVFLRVTQAATGSTVSKPVLLTPIR